MLCDKNSSNGRPLLGVGRLVIVRRREFRYILLHQASLLLRGSSLHPGSLVARARVATTAVVGEEGLATDELAPDTNHEGADNHADNGHADTSCNSHENRKDDVGCQLAEKQLPAIGLVEQAVVALVVVRLSVIGFSLGAAHHAGAAVHLHLVELVGDDGLPLAQNGGALLVLLHRRGYALGCGLLDFANQEVVVGGLDQVDSKVGKAVDEDRADFDDLQVNDNEVQSLVGGVLGVDLKAEAELLLDNGLVSAWSKFVVAQKSFGSVLSRIPCLVAVLFVALLLLWLLGNLRCNKNICKWVGMGVQLEAVEHQSVTAGGLVDGKAKLEMAVVLLVVLRLAMMLIGDGRTSWAVQVDGLGLCDGDAFERNGLEDLDIVGIDLGHE